MKPQDELMLAKNKEAIKYIMSKCKNGKQNLIQSDEFKTITHCAKIDGQEELIAAVYNYLTQLESVGQLM